MPLALSRVAAVVGRPTAVREDLSDGQETVQDYDGDYDSDFYKILATMQATMMTLFPTFAETTVR